MRVLTVGNFYPPHGQGGYEAVWRSFTEHLRAQGDVVRVLCSDARRAGGGPETDPDVHRELRMYWRDGAWIRPGLLGAYAIERHNRRVLGRHIAGFAPDAVMWWSMGGLSLSLIGRTPRTKGSDPSVHAMPEVGVVHDGWLVYGPDRDAWRRRRPDLRRGTWTFNSAATLERARAEGYELADAIVIHPGIAAERFTPSEPGPWAWRLAYVGRVDPQKGVATLIEALAQLPAEATAEITGPGESCELARLCALVEHHGLEGRVTFAGAREPEDVAQAYTRADAVVFPVTWPEPFGLVPLEAMASGRPVLATGTGGSAEYLRDGENALVFEPGDAGALARAVRRIANDAALRERLRAEGLRTVARFTEEAFNRRLEEVLRACVRQARAGT